MPTDHPYASAPRLPEAPELETRTLTRRPELPLELEIGPGRGGFLFERLAFREDIRMVGLEVRGKWAQLVDDKLARLGFGDRGRVFAEDAKLALPRLGPAGSVSRVFIHFPDPWWKKRHQKRLVVGNVALDEIARLLETGGELFVQTDVEERADRYELEIGRHIGFSPLGDLPDSARMQTNPYGATSHRERRAITDQIPIFRLRYRRNATPTDSARR